MTFWTEILRFPVSSRNQCMIYAETAPTKREVENIIMVLRGYIDIDVFEDSDEDTA